MEKDRQILAFIKKVRKRLCKNVWIRTMLWALFAGIVLWGIFNTIALFVPFYEAILYGLGAFLLALIVGWIWAGRLYPNLRRTTLQIDAKGLKERVTTSYELAGKTDFYSEMQKKDTLQKIQHIHIRKLFPVNVKKRVYFALFAALIFAVTTAMLPTKSKEIAREQHELKEAIDEKEQELETIVDEFQNSYELTEEQQKALEELLKDTVEELNEVTLSEQIAKVEERFQNKLKERFEDALNNYLEAKALENAIHEMNEDGMTEEEKAELSQKLDELKQAAKDEAYKELLEQMQKELEENGQISPETMDKLEQFIDKSQGQVGGHAGQATQPGQFGQGDQKGQTAQPGQGNQNGQPGQNMQPGQGNQSGQGSQNGQQGQGNQNGQGSQNGQGGPGGSSGWSNGSKYANEEKGNSGGERVMISDTDMPYNETLNGHANANGESNMMQSDQTFEWRGESVEFNRVIGEYANRAYDSLQRSKLPDSMKNLIRDYFTGLNE